MIKVEEIKVRIRQLRKEHGLTMVEFAKVVGVSPGNVGDWESSKRPSVPGAHTLISISKAFDVSIDWLLLGVEKDSQQQYSEHIKPQYAADPEVYEEIMELALRLDKVGLLMLLDEVKNVHSDRQETNVL